MKTWLQIEADDTIDCIEHPLTGFMLPKNEFAKEFELFLSELDGTTASDYFDFYLERCTIIRSAYRFRDEDSKQDFIDACIDLGLIPTFAETLQGELNSEKLERANRSSEDLVRDFQSLKSKECVSKYHSSLLPSASSSSMTTTRIVAINAEKKKYRTKAQQVEHTYQKLRKEYEAEPEGEKKEKLKSKLERVIALMEHSM